MIIKRDGWLELGLRMNGREIERLSHRLIHAKVTLQVLYLSRGMVREISELRAEIASIERRLERAERLQEEALR